MLILIHYQIQASDYRSRTPQSFMAILYTASFNGTTEQVESSPFFFFNSLNSFFAFQLIDTTDLGSENDSTSCSLPVLLGRLEKATVIWLLPLELLSTLCAVEPNATRYFVLDCRSRAQVTYYAKLKS